MPKNKGHPATEETKGARMRTLPPRKLSLQVLHLPLLLRLLIDILGIHPRAPVSRWSIRLLVGKVPTLEVPRPRAQIRREPQPTQVGRQTPRRERVDAGPDVGQVGGRAGQDDDVRCSLDGPFEAEEEGHPDEVEAELEGEEGGALLLREIEREDRSVSRSINQPINQ